MCWAAGTGWASLRELGSRAGWRREMNVARAAQEDEGNDARHPEGSYGVAAGRHPAQNRRGRCGAGGRGRSGVPFAVAGGGDGGIEPGREFVGPGEDAAALAWQAMYGQAAFFFPALDGAFVPAKKGGNFLPGIDAAIFSGAGRCAGHHNALNLSRIVRVREIGAEVETV